MIARWNSSVAATGVCCDPFRIDEFSHDGIPVVPPDSPSTLSGSTTGESLMSLRDAIETHEIPARR
jgi:hypothetical protein